MLWDTHMHTHFSVDCEADTLDMIHASMNAGVDGICFTDHLDLEETQTTPASFPLDLSAYFKEMQSFQKQFESRFPIYIGVEIGLQAYLEELLPNIIQQYPFDFVITVDSNLYRIIEIGRAHV